MEQENREELMHPAQAAHHLGVSITTIYHWFNQGHLRGEKWGPRKRVRVYASGVLRLKEGMGPEKEKGGTSL